MLLNIINKTINEFRRVWKHPALRRFIAHNERVFPVSEHAERRKPVVLLELNAMHSAHIAYSYLANVLATNNQAKINAYVQKPHRGLLQRVLFKFRKATGQNDFGAYKSFGTTAFTEMTLSPNQQARARKLFEGVFGRLTTKSDIEALTINDVWVGDLVYDSFLMTYRKPTIDKDSPEFRRSLHESIEIFVFWEDYLIQHDVRAINVSHCVYTLAIPLRIAVQRNIPVFQANATYIYRLRSSNLFMFAPQL